MIRQPLNQILLNLFKPPFYGLPVAVWIYFVWCFLVYPDSYILHGNFVDPDDYMHLVQTLDWLKGQHWFDLVQHRLNPPDGTPMHYSRLYELPLAILIAPLRQWLGDIGAATVAAAVWPLIALAIYFMVVRWAARPFLDEDWVNITSYISLFAIYIMLEFMPGRADHHGTEALLIAAVFGFTARTIMEPSVIRWPLGAGLFLSLAVVIGFEVLPWVILISGWLGLRAMVKGKEPAFAAMIFGLSLSLSGLVFLMLTKPWDHIFEPDLLAYSIVYVIFLLSIALCLSGVALASRTRFVTLRYVVGIFLLFFTGVTFLYWFPGLSGGPYNAINPALLSTVFSKIPETTPFMAWSLWPVKFCSIISPLLLALAVSKSCWGRAKDSETFWLWGMMFILLGAAILLALLYQTRIMTYAELFSVIPLAVFTQKAWLWLGAQRERRLLAAEIGLFLLIGPLPMVLIPALTDGRPFNTGVMLFPVQKTSGGNCDMHLLADVLNGPHYYNGHSRVIMNSVNDGPELLFRTHHNVLAGPYHMNVSGNLDSTAFFSTMNPNEATAIAYHRGVDLVTLCNELPFIYQNSEAEDFASHQHAKTSNTNKVETFAQHLVDGDTLPWLKASSYSNLGNMILLEVRWAKPKKKSNLGQP